MTEPDPPGVLPFLARPAERAVQVAAALRVAIVSGDLAAGGRLVPERIAAEMGVSRPTVIAAVRRLAREGLVTIGQNGRPYVVGLTPRYVADLYHFRMALDQAVVSTIAEQALPAEAVDRLQDITALMKLRAHQGDLSAFAGLDLDFHTTYLSLAGNQFLAGAWEAISDVAYALLTVTDRLSQALPLIAGIHEEIFLGLRAADGPRVVAALQRHYQTGENILADPYHEQHGALMETAAPAAQFAE